MKKNLIIKVCGMLNTANREKVEKLPVDLLGFIFYPQSKRYAGNQTQQGLFHTSKPAAGVFVDESAFEILALVKNFQLEYVQLHGKENPKTCRLIKNQGYKVIKAVNVDESFNFKTLDEYETSVDYFLFDTKTSQPGGSGKKFNWNILGRYQGRVPFILSGGIAPGDAQEILNLDHPLLAGIDLNSGFEDSPGIKNIDKLKGFIQEIKQ